MPRRLIAVALSLAFVACTDHDSTVRTLNASGFTDITTTGYALGCSDSDFSSTGFRAKNPKGTAVEGVVCCGAWLKGCTVRF